MRKLAIDYGNVKIGLALSDPMGMLASPLETYRSEGIKRDLIYLANVITKHQVDTVVIGLPINMNGSMGERVEKTRIFGAKLAEVITVPIIFRDERLTTVAAERHLIDSGIRREKRKGIIDQMAAQIFLQSYLDSLKYASATQNNCTDSVSD